MNHLSKVFLFKIAATVLFWCVPLILLPERILKSVGLPDQPSYMFARMLGWAYLALCFAYGFGLRASLQGRRDAGPIWTGIVSNGGACGVLLYFGLTGSWSGWGVFVQFLLWSSIVATLSITIGLYVFGVREGAAAPPHDAPTP